MTVSHAMFENAPELSGKSSAASPRRQVMILAVLIFTAEIVAMIILYWLKIPNYLLESLLDGSIMLTLILPGLYWLQLKPLSFQMEERDRVERALRTNEELLQKVLTLLPVGVIVLDQRGEIVHGNPRSVQIWGDYRTAGPVRYAEFKGWWGGSGKRVEPLEWAASRAIQRGETILNEEIEIETFDGLRKTILNSSVPILDEHKDVQGALVVNQDITSQKAAEKERLRLNALLDRFFSSTGMLIAYMDQDFNFIRVNDTYAQAAGQPAEFFPGKNLFELYPNEKNQAVFHTVVENGGPISARETAFQFSASPPDAEAFWDWSLQPVKDERGLVAGVVLSLVEVTERKQAEMKLAAQNEELRNLYHSESVARQFAETLSAASQALSETLNLDQVINTLLEHIDQIVPATTSMVTLLEDETRLAVRSVRGDPGLVKWKDDLASQLDGITDSMLRRIKQARKSLVIPNLMSGDSHQAQGGGSSSGSWLVVPILSGDKLIGLVELARLGGQDFNPEHICWAEALVNQAAIAIQNAWLFQQVRASSERLQSLTRKLVEIQENERLHIARELHDEAGQALSSLKISLGRLEQDPECPPQVSQRLQELKGVADGVLEELHHLAVDLRPTALDRLGLVAALEQYAGKLNTEGQNVHFKAIGLSDRRLPRDVETSLYRIVQEALTNVVSHAQASSVSILLKRQSDKVMVLVEDDGVGFLPDEIENSNRLGLVGMRERAEMFGGTLMIESFPGEGTTIIVEVPDVH